MAPSTVRMGPWTGFNRSRHPRWTPSFAFEEWISRAGISGRIGIGTNIGRHLRESKNPKSVRRKRVRAYRALWYDPEVTRNEFSTNIKKYITTIRN
ncbi:hypothetical protein CDAR_77811 [Caerostris darwini]|uniref:Uncharacterized protein n=1 Tax=Caerostris darwini TaxID=1538125 RepID=A0AAV4NCF8_9ARAC|nr:hypothetical protein CDAR_77811 [Caerostris darwini]